MTRERISRILELREVLLSFQTGFNLINAAVGCAILESISGLEPRYWKLFVTVSSFCPFTLISVLLPLVFLLLLLFCHQLGLLGTDLHVIGRGGFVETPN